jgi:RNA polymerase sigma-70 factor (ECF subfamily)
MDNTYTNRGCSDGDYFVRQLIVHRKRIYAFILTLVPNATDADDIMQDTAALMWEKYQKSAEITNFSAWGVQIAHYKVLEYRRRQYNKKVQFNNELFDTILGGSVAVSERFDERMEALKECMAKLDEKSFKLVLLRHQKGHTIKSIAESLSLSIHSAYKQVYRVHDVLLRCVRRTLRIEGAV